MDVLLEPSERSVREAHGLGPSRLMHRSQERCCKAQMATRSFRAGDPGSCRASAEQADLTHRTLPVGGTDSERG